MSADLSPPPSPERRATAAPGRFDVRPARETDREAWLALRCALRPDTDAAQHRREMTALRAEGSRAAAFLCVVPGRGPVGLVEVSRRELAEGCESSPVGYLEALYVAPALRGKGVGRCLVDAAERWARTRGCRELASGAAVGDESSHAVHARLGFAESARVVTFRKRIEVHLGAEPSAPGPTLVPIIAEPAARPRARAAGHYAVLTGGLASFLLTDLWSGGFVRGLLLPFVDFLFVVYLLVWFATSKYRARTIADARSSEMLAVDAGAPRRSGPATHGPGEVAEPPESER